MLRLFLSVVLLGTLAAPLAAQTDRQLDDRTIRFPDVADGVTLVVDLHTHSVFSDGEVWPSVRVREAQRDGLDALAFTEHLEYQPHSHDIPHPDRNRATEIGQAAADGDSLIVIPGAEITRALPFGHANAVFVTDANALLVDDAIEAFREAKRQGAFAFINHPNWTGQRPDGVAALTDEHRQLVAEGLVGGIEVVNDLTYSDEALGLALEHGLAILGTSDVHGLVDWQYKIAEGGHRPVTLVLAAERSAEGIQAGLEAGRTVAYFEGTLVGRAEHLGPLLDATLTVGEALYRPETHILLVDLYNRSSAPLTLMNRSSYTLHDGAGLVTVPAHGKTTIEVKTGTRLASLAMSFEVLNAITAPGIHPTVTKVFEVDG